MKNYWTLMRIPETLIEGSEQWKLLQEFPTPATFEDKAYVFVTHLEDAAEPMVLEVEEEQTSEELYEIIHTYLFENNDRSVWLTKSEATKLHLDLTPPPEEEL